MAKQVTGTAKNLHYAYSLGAAVVIVGALFKITHFQIWFLTGNVVLALGLITEAVIFTLAAFLDVPKEEPAWEKVYPELDGGIAKNEVKTGDMIDSKIDSILTSKLDKLMADAKIDVQLFESLKSGLDNFAANVSDINKITDTAKNMQNYSDQLITAANHVESLNALYHLQYDKFQNYIHTAKGFMDNLNAMNEGSGYLVKDIENLSHNLKELNKVYGGMLSAMRNKE